MSERINGSEYKTEHKAVGVADSLSSVKGKTELLSPAGDISCLYAAVEGGCDAVYAGSDRFGARAYAGNLNPSEFIDAIGYMHLFDKKIYLTLNTLIKPREFGEIYEYVRPFYEAGLDGIIVQDLGVLDLMLKEFKGMEVHASTQMSIASVYGARLLADMGVKRIVPARELSLKEISRIYDETGLDLECFIHGAMCYSYSGMCLASSFLGGRSGNRGRCAGPCRQPYSIREMKDKYVLSMKDMCTIDILDELVKSGIRSFKIEGRMKSPEYVYTVTSIYRKYIDMAEAGETYHVDARDRARLRDVYSRGGIQPGYYHRRNGRDMITIDKGSYKREDTEKKNIKKKQYPVSLYCRAIHDEPIFTEVTTPDMKHRVHVTGPVIARADKRPVLEEDIKRQLNKTGGSDFCFTDIMVDTDGLGFIPVSILNDQRRNVLDALKDEMIDGHKRSL